MAKKPCSIETTIDGDDYVVRIKNGRVAEASAPRVNEATGKPNKKGMVAHTGGFQPINESDFISVMLMRKV